ncbi:uracil-DNA glycosylase [Deinococcus yavapaiensis]|nr:uracil-DNA glycosylase [Deinococcus yavapaiensis]
MASDTASSFPEVPTSWQPFLDDVLRSAPLRELAAFLREERARHTVYPPAEDVFNALRFTPYDRASVLILGQDPYHGPRQAHGLAFSVRPGVRPPPSLVNIFKELRDDVGVTPPKHGYLRAWAEQGVLLLNAVLTVRAGEPNSHAGRGWEDFTDAVIRALDDKEERVVFVLWGAYARKKKKLVTNARHVVVESAHPSPLSATKFFGSKPFSQVNAALQEVGRPSIDWSLPTTVEED